MFNHSKLTAILRKNGLYSLLDIGANSGEWAVEQINNMSELDIFCIEGNPECQQDLHSTGLQYSTVLLSDSCKEVKFYTNPANSKCTGSSYYKEDSHHFTGEFKTFTTTTLDLIITKKFDCIKIDTQGSELDILKGGINLLKSVKLICIETSLEEYNIGSPLSNEVDEFMKSIGFKYFDIVGDSRYADGKIFQEDRIYLCQHQ